MQNYKKWIYYFSIVSTFFYIIYRNFFTLPNEWNTSMFFAIIVLLIEEIDFIFFCIYVINVLVKDYNTPKCPKKNKKDYPELDIFIASVNEEIDLVEETIIACKNMKYPNKKKIHIYLCDDGNRKGMKNLSKKQKVEYITRKDNQNAKAGNYNNALKQTKSPYIVVFDADMKPTKDFLMKSIPYLFTDEKIGFVQLPQSFDNSDIFQNKYKLKEQIPFEQDYFYHRIQLSKKNNNSVIFCGTNAILSREALEDIGGFATKTITEDFATGLLMEGHGFKGIALPFDEAYGKNVEDISSLLKQRIRWCRGCIQTYHNYKIIMNKGLKISQKASYLSGIYYWFFGIRNMIFLLIPLLYSFFNIKIIQGNILIFTILFSMQYIIKRFIIDWLEERKVSSSWNRIYEIILSPIICIESILESIGISKKNFEVTIKKKNNNKSWKLYLVVITHIVLLILNMMGLNITIKKGISYGFLDVYISLFWLSTNCIYLMMAIIFDLSHNNSTKIEIKKEKKNYPLSSILLIWWFFLKEEIKVKRLITILIITTVICIGISWITTINIKRPL